MPKVSHQVIRAPVTQTQGALISEPKLVITMFMGPRWREKVRCLGNSQEAAAKNVSFLTSCCCCLDGISRTAVKVRARREEQTFPGLPMLRTHFISPTFFWGRQTGIFLVSTGLRMLGLYVCAYKSSFQAQVNTHVAVYPSNEHLLNTSCPVIF